MAAPSKRPEEEEVEEREVEEGEEEKREWRKSPTKAKGGKEDGRKGKGRKGGEKKGGERKERKKDGKAKEKEEKKRAEDEKAGIKSVVGHPPTIAVNASRVAAETPLQKMDKERIASCAGDITDEDEFSDTYWKDKGSRQKWQTGERRQRSTSSVTYRCTSSQPSPTAPHPKPSLLSLDADSDLDNLSHLGESDNEMPMDLTDEARDKLFPKVSDGARKKPNQKHGITCCKTVENLVTSSIQS